MRHLIIMMVACSLLTCAEGRVPPNSTHMAGVTESLTFWYGDNQPCARLTQDGIFLEPHSCDVQCESCVAIDIVQPPVQVTLEPFCMDEHEVTNLQYLYCEEMGACPRRPLDNLGKYIEDYGINERYDNYPALVLSYEGARAYCEFVGKRVPTELEWERVAGGAAQNADLSDKRYYPFLPAGDADARNCFDKDVRIASCRSDTSPQTAAVSTSLDDVVTLASGRKVYDLGGNVKEWTSSYYSAHPTCEPGSRCNGSEIDCDCGGADCYKVCPEEIGEVSICAPAFETGAVLTPNDLAASSGADRVVKGGFYDMGLLDLCQARSTGRAHEKQEGQDTHNFLGVRCVANISHPDCAL